MAPERCVVLLGAVLCAAVALAGESREDKVRGDKARVEAAGFWIYNDFAKARTEAQSSGKPLVVSLRCIPCEECVKLDDELVDRDPRLRPLLERFVRVRLIATNGLDLSLFQFDTDQSFAVFFLRADGTIYGRFGTRSDHAEWADDVSIEGLRKALERALALHSAWPEQQAALALKRGPPPPVPVPEAYPDLAAKYTRELNYAGKVVPSCIHCHQVGEAERSWHLARDGRLPESLLFPYPHPKAVGMVLDPGECATLRAVKLGSAAAAAGLRAGDVLERVGTQVPLSIADVQWVLHHTPAEGGEVPLSVRRAGAEVALRLTLAPGWRRADDLSWRASTWSLRRRALGGLKLEAQTKSAKARGLSVVHVGQHAPHDVAKRAGFQKDDVLLSFDGRTDFERETDVLAYALTRASAGGVVPVRILRQGQERTLELPAAR